MKTRITLLFVIALAIFSENSKAQSVPTSWTSKGVGGGGGLFSPSISQHNGNNLYLACDMSEMFHSSNFGQSWSDIHFQQLSGNRNTEVQFTLNPNKLYAIKKPGNFYIPAKSYDGGSTWTNATNPCSPNGAFQYFANPSDTDQVVLSDMNAIYFSNAENSSYSTILTKAGVFGLHLAGVYFENKDTVYVCSNDSLIYTFNGGLNWQNALAGTNNISSNEHIVSFKGAKQGGKWVFYAVTIQITAPTISKIYKTYSEDYPNYKGTYKLSQGSSQWQSISNKLPNNPTGQLIDKPYLIGLASNDTSVVYLAGSSTGLSVTLGTVFKSTNGGNSFTTIFLTSSQKTQNSNITTGWMGAQSLSNPSSKFLWNGLTFISGFEVDPTNSSRIVCADKMTIHTSIDQGNNWNQAYTDFNYQNTAGTLIQQSHSYKTSGLEPTVSYWLQWSNATNIFASYNDIVARRTTDGGNLWSFDISGLDSTKINDVNMTLVNASTGKMYAACGEQPGSNGDYTDARVATANGRVSVSSDNGINWSTLKSFGHAVTSISLDPNNPTGMYATVITILGGSGGIYHCSDITNSSSPWTILTPPARTQKRPLQIIALNTPGELIAVYGSRDTTLNQTYGFSKSSGVFYSTDYGNTWADNNHIGMQKSSATVEIDPSDLTQSTWLAFVGSNGSTGGIYKTINKGLNWTPVYGSPVLSGTFHPTLPNEMYICTEIGGLLYATNVNSNTTWVPTPVSSYSFRRPQKVFFNPYNVNEVWVTSFGNGIKMGTTNITTGILDANSYEFTIYPNPTNNFLNIILNESTLQLSKIIIYDVTGKEVKSLDIKSNSKYLQTDVSFLPKGLYLLTLQSEKNKHTKTFIVE